MRTVFFFLAAQYKNYMNELPTVTAKIVDGATYL